MNTRAIIILLFTVLKALSAIAGTGYAIHKGIKLRSFWEGVKWFWIAAGILLLLTLLEFGILFLMPIE